MKWRQFFYFVVLILLGLLLMKNLGKLGQLVDQLKNLNIWILLLILPIRYGYYWASTRFFQHFFKLYKRNLTYSELFPGVVSFNFLNAVVPTGGLSGATYFARAYDQKITSRQSYLAQFFLSIAVVLSLVIVLASSFVILFFANTISQISFRLVLLVISALIAISLGIIAVTINPTLFKKALFVVTRPANWILKLFHRDALNQSQINRFVEGYNDLIKLFADNPRKAVRPFMDALITVLCEIASIMVVYLAFGHWINPGIIGAAYVLALISSVLSFFTAGVGPYEATMVAVSVALGVPFSLAFSVTATYRLIAFWMFIPVGLYFYKRQAVDEAI